MWKNGQVVGVEVHRVVFRKGDFAGLRPESAIFRAPIVVYNGNVKRLFDLVDKREFKEEFVREIEELKPSVSAFVVYLGVNKKVNVESLS